MNLGLLFIIILGIILYILSIRKFIKSNWDMLEAGYAAWMGLALGTVGLLILLVAFLSQYEI